MRTAEQIIDAVAHAARMVTPVPPYVPLSPAFVVRCLDEQRRDALDALADAMRKHGASKHAVRALADVARDLAG